LRSVGGEFRIVVVVLQIGIGEDFVFRRDIRNCAHREAVEDKTYHRVLVHHVRHRLQELEIREPVELGIGHSVFNEAARIAIEAEEQRPRVDSDWLDGDVELLVLRLFL